MSESMSGIDRALAEYIARLQKITANDLTTFPSMEDPPVSPPDSNKFMQEASKMASNLTDVEPDFGCFSRTQKLEAQQTDTGEYSFVSASERRTSKVEFVKDLRDINSAEFLADIEQTVKEQIKEESDVSSTTNIHDNKKDSIVNETLSDDVLISEECNETEDEFKKYLNLINSELEDEIKHTNNTNTEKPIVSETKTHSPISEATQPEIKENTINKQEEEEEKEEEEDPLAAYMSMIENASKEQNEIVQQIHREKESINSMKETETIEDNLESAKTNKIKPQVDSSSFKSLMSEDKELLTEEAEEDPLAAYMSMLGNDSKEQDDTLLQNDTELEVEDSPPIDISFRQWYDDICHNLRSEEGLLDKVMEQFDALNTDMERIKYTWRLKGVAGVTKVTEDFEDKNATEAEKYERVYDLLVQKDAERSVEAISRSIMLTPTNQIEHLAPRFGKRAWALSASGHYIEAARDAQRSLSYSKHPKPDMWGSYEVLGTCCAQLEDLKVAESHLVKALELLRKSKASNDVKAATAGRITQVLKTIQKQTNTISRNKNKKKKQSMKIAQVPLSPTISTKPNPPRPPPELSGGVHPNFSSLSSAVEVMESSSRGRYMIAKRDIKPGDVLVVDKPFAAVVHREQSEHFCETCRSRAAALLPCTVCAAVGYCSEECEEKGKRGPHSIECRMSKRFKDSALSPMTSLNIRILTTARWQTLNKLRESLMIRVEEGDKQRVDKDESFNGENEESTSYSWKGIYSSIDYLTVFEQEPNSFSRSFGDMMRRSAMAIYLTGCLNSTNFFGDSSPSKEELEWTACLLLRHLQSCSCNAYELGELVVGKEGIQRAEVKSFGGAVFSTISLSNHSCCTNTTRTTSGDVGVITAISTIPKGTEIFDNYGYHFHQAKKDERNSVLRTQYKFDCGCEACRNEWDLYPYYRKDRLMLRCNKCKEVYPYNEGATANCPSCGAVVAKPVKEISKSMSRFKSGMKALSEKDDSTALPLLLAHQTLLDREVDLPSEHFTDCQEAVRQTINLHQNNLRVY